MPVAEDRLSEAEAQTRREMEEVARTRRSNRALDQRVGQLEGGMHAHNTMASQTRRDLLMLWIYLLFLNVCVLFVLIRLRAMESKEDE